MSTMRAFSVEYFDRIDIEIPDAKTEVTITSIPPNIEVRVGKVNAGPLLNFA